MHLERRQLKDLDAFVRTFSSLSTVYKLQRINSVLCISKLSLTLMLLKV